MPHVNLRAAVLADLDDLLSMMEDFNAHEHIPWTRAEGAAPLRTLMERADLGAVVILEDAEGALCGYAILTWGFDLEWGGRDAFITELYLRPEARGRGLGRAALALLEAEARRHGARALHLMVRRDNPAALHLYLSAGFEDPERLLLTRPLR